MRRGRGGLHLAHGAVDMLLRVHHHLHAAFVGRLLIQDHLLQTLVHDLEILLPVLLKGRKILYGGAHLVEFRETGVGDIRIRNEQKLILDFPESLAQRILDLLHAVFQHLLKFTAAEETTGPITEKAAGSDPAAKQAARTGSAAEGSAADGVHLLEGNDPGLGDSVLFSAVRVLQQVISPLPVSRGTEPLLAVHGQDLLLRLLLSIVRVLFLQKTH